MALESASDLVTLAQAARELRLSWRQCWDRCLRGEIAVVTIAGKHFVSRSEVARYRKVLAQHPPRVRGSAVGV